MSIRQRGNHRALVTIINRYRFESLRSVRHEKNLRIVGWFGGFSFAAIGVVEAAENAAGFYLLGSKSSMAGYTPPPGTYLTDLNYQQVSGDSGAGAVIGDFEGRVTALGPVFTYSFQLGSLSVSSEWKYFHEFDTRNRVEGDGGFVSFSMPLGK